MNQTPSVRVVHLVKNYKTLCGTATSDLQKTHTWVEAGGPETGDANCPICKPSKKKVKTP